MSEELLPCPFCGSGRIHESASWVECQECGATTRSVDNEGEAIALWNQRAPSSGGGQQEVVAERYLTLADEIVERLDMGRDHALDILLERFDRIDAMLHPAPEAPGAWRPIESAPKDGRPYLLASSTARWSGVGHFAAAGEWRTLDHRRIAVPLTHWQPFLAAPDSPAPPSPDTTPQAADVEGWRPIASAPKDGTPFHAWCPDDGGVRLVSWGKVSHIPMVGWATRDEGPEDSDICTPTHWIPLSPAPEP